MSSLEGLTPEVNPSNIDSIPERVSSLLTKRGIDSNNIDIGPEKIITTNILDMSQTDSARGNILTVMEQLRIDPETEITVRQRKLFFQEDVSKGPLSEMVNFANREKEQKMNIYTFDPKKGLTGSAPIVIFSHGGSIRPETTLKSSFLSLIKANSEQQGKPVILVAMDHRGSESHEAKINFSLEDRSTDIEVVLMYTIQNLLEEYKNKGISWNGEVHLIGNSMGGHVVACTAKELKPDRIILPQPAAYSEESQLLPFGSSFGIAIRKPNSWKTSIAFDNFEKYLREGGTACLIGAEKDEVIPGGVTNRYIKEVTYHYLSRLIKAEGKNTFDFGYTYIPESHEKTTPDEITAISKSLQN